MAQSATLASFFSPFGELDDIAEEAFPVELGRHTLELVGFRLESDTESGEDVLLGMFNLVERDDEGNTVNIIEQPMRMLHLPPAVADDVYRVSRVRLWIAPELIKGRLRRFLHGVARGARERYPSVQHASDLRPGLLL